MKVSKLHCALLLATHPAVEELLRPLRSRPRCLPCLLGPLPLAAPRLTADTHQVVTPEQAQGYRSATIAGGLKGAGLGFGIAIPAHFLLQRRAAYRAVPITLKTLGYVCLLVPLISIAAEKSGEAYERSQWTGVGARELERSRDKEERRWEDLSTSQKVRDWAARNKWGLIAGR